MFIRDYAIICSSRIDLHICRISLIHIRDFIEIVNLFYLYLKSFTFESFNYIEVFNYSSRICRKALSASSRHFSVSMPFSLFKANVVVTHRPPPHSWCECNSRERDPLRIGPTADYPCDISTLCYSEIFDSSDPGVHVSMIQTVQICRSSPI